jgi:hypothetical protein
MKRKNRNMEIAPVQVTEISRRARRERSEAVWKLLQSIFSNGAGENGPMLREVPKAQACH